MAWPIERAQDLKAFYGAFELRTDGFPTAGWESRNLTRIIAPYPLAASWDPSIPITRLRCHRKIAESLRGVLAAILAHYGSINGVRAARGSASTPMARPSTSIPQGTLWARHGWPMPA